MRIFRHYGGRWRDTASGRIVSYATVKRSRTARRSARKRKEARAARGDVARKGWRTRRKRERALEKAFREFQTARDTPGWRPYEGVNRGVVGWTEPLDERVLEGFRSAGIEILPEGDSPRELYALAKRIESSRRSVHGWILSIKVGDKPVLREIVVYTRSTQQAMHEAGVPVATAEIREHGERVLIEKRGKSKAGRMYVVFEVSAYELYEAEGTWSALEAADRIKTCARARWARVEVRRARKPKKAKKKRPKKKRRA